MRNLTKFPSPDGVMAFKGLSTAAMALEDCFRPLMGLWPLKTFKFFSPEQRKVSVP